MKRIMLLVTVALCMAAVVAGPAQASHFAEPPCPSGTTQVNTADENDAALIQVCIDPESETSLGTQPVCSEGFAEVLLQNPGPDVPRGRACALLAPHQPTTKEQCKNGGFKEFAAPGFRTQGECVAFVERGSSR
jgi:hypothetical protein